MPVLCGVHIPSQSADQELVTDMCAHVCVYGWVCVCVCVCVYGHWVLLGLVICVLCFCYVGKECVYSCSCINGLLFCKPFMICGITEIWSNVLQLVLVILRHCRLVSEMEF
jgi:hypothetical protein